MCKSTALHGINAEGWKPATPKVMPFHTCSEPGGGHDGKPGDRRDGGGLGGSGDGGGLGGGGDGGRSGGGGDGGGLGGGGDGGGLGGKGTKSAIGIAIWFCCSAEHTPQGAFVAGGVTNVMTVEDTMVKVCVVIGYDTITKYCKAGAVMVRVCK